MKTILLFACFITLLATSGCLVEGRRGGAVIVGPPVVVVHAAPVLVVRPPEVIVR